MKTSTVLMKVKVSASDAWEVISDLYNVENYLPGVSNSRVKFTDDYTIRTIELMDGSKYEERILRLDDEQMTLLYNMVDPSPFQYKNLEGVISVSSVSDTCCQISWSCNYEVTNELYEETDALLTLIMSLGIKGIEKYCLKMLACVV